MSATLSAQDGAALYKSRCASCHDGQVERAPRREALAAMSADNVRFALTLGKMKAQARGLNPQQLSSLAEFLTGKKLGVEALPQQAFCSDAGAKFSNPFDQPYWNGWGAGTANHRAQPAAMARLSAADVPKLKLKWAFGFPGDSRAFSQPTVAGGRLFTGSAGRKVYSLNAANGCIHWIFDAEFPVRTAISIGPAGAGWAAYFGDQHATAYAVDAGTGKLLWKVRVEEHPAAMITGAPALSGGRLLVPVSSFEEVTGANPKYECCKFRGSVSALDAFTGKVIWKSYTIPEEPKPVRNNKDGVQLWGPSGAGVWSSPTIDEKKKAVYVSTGDAYSDPAAQTSDAFLAFDLETGKLLWSRQMTEGDAFVISCGQPGAANCPEANGPDYDFGSSPILVSLPNGRRALIAGQKSGLVHAVDPDQQGEVLWQTRVGKGSAMGGVQWGSAADAGHVYVALSDVKVGPADASDPAAQPGFVGLMKVDPKAGGGLFALKLSNGEKVWHTPNPGCTERPGCSPAQSAAVTLIPGVVFSGALDGHLRAYSAADGRILWDMDTVREYSTVNGVKATGGAIDGPGPVVVNGMVYTNSGYGFLGTMPGNVLLAFAP